MRVEIIPNLFPINFILIYKKGIKIGGKCVLFEKEVNSREKRIFSWERREKYEQDDTYSRVSFSFEHWVSWFLSPMPGIRWETEGL